MHVIERKAHVALNAMPPSKRSLALAHHFPLFSATHLKIRPKEVDAGLISFCLNPAQQLLHDTCERQLRERGRVRLLVVKGRQLGSSTYVGGRYYHKTSMRDGVRAFILTHDQEGTDALFEMTRRYHEHNPKAPPVSRSSAKELMFSDTDSGYKVGTAGSKAVGRGQTIQYFHGSEVAFWPNADSHIRGVLNAVPKSGGTEIIFESTGDGPQGAFYKMCMAALGEKGADGDYDAGFEVLFIGWWLDPNYRATPPEHWEPPEEFETYRRHNDLDLEQTYWAYLKNAESADALGVDRDKICWMFRREYPQNVAEAFQTAGDSCFIAPNLVMAARKNIVAQTPDLPLILGVDPAQGGKDKTAMIDRKGRIAGRRIFELLDEPDAMEIARRIIIFIKQHDPAKVFIDFGGGGKEIADIVSNQGFGKYITAVNFGKKASDSKRFMNRRAEMWADTLEWLKSEAGVSIPDDDDLQASLCAPEWGPGATIEKPDGRLQLESKDHIRERLGKSPDIADALALTFAMPVAEDTTDYVGHSAKRGDKHTGY